MACLVKIRQHCEKTGLYAVITSKLARAGTTNLFYYSLPKPHVFVQIQCFVFIQAVGRKN